MAEGDVRLIDAVKKQTDGGGDALTAGRNAGERREIGAVPADMVKACQRDIVRCAKAQRVERVERVIGQNVVEGDDAGVVNGLEQRDNVSPVSAQSAKIEGGVLTVKLPALSWNVIRLA